MGLIVLILTAYFANCVLDIKWDGLRVQWNQNVTNPNYFVKFSRTEHQAVIRGFTKIGDCDLTAKWRGRRYIQDSDYTVILLFDIKGYIAGIQTAIPTTSTYPPLKLKPPFIDEGGRSVLTAYFTDPSKICTTGRTADEFAIEGTGSTLYIQDNIYPEASTRMPSSVDEARRTAPWTISKCLNYMGLHYYHNITSELECDSLFPVGLLYHKGELLGFAWLFMQYLPLKRYETVAKRFYPYVLTQVPKCFDEYDYFTSQHVYLIKNVEDVIC
ncbi:unnamed protein product [Candidula unifasciata]|uniref:Uncharacterized protein n=1 Tax=Candidula unifasciata TaxID=100452 RepID=A0A8S3YKW1_9EUPU|nr:unnamed protein product [Candidula unifasciata]